jgi:hypothetical protein
MGQPQVIEVARLARHQVSSPIQIRQAGITIALAVEMGQATTEVDFGQGRGQGSRGFFFMRLSPSGDGSIVVTPAEGLFSPGYQVGSSFTRPMFGSSGPLFLSGQGSFPLA